ncbi:MAG TPA: hypothetical protein VN672_03550 [Solirubrobacteraceae bacterium]|nr:hypothetical protein [Solirubrobacteraceae bacterium]
MRLLTRRQLACLAELPDDYRVLGERAGTPIVEGPHGETLRVQPNGRMVATSVQKVQSYLEMERC